MTYRYNNNEYNIKIIRKDNKNTYIRVNENLEIIITTNYFNNDSNIKKIIIEKEEAIVNMLVKQLTRNKLKNKFRYLGKVYDIIILTTIEKIELYDDKIVIPNLKELDKWLNENINYIFKERMDSVYKKIEDKISYPDLKIRKMKTRWGVCHKKGYITLNKELIKYDINVIDYVIIHELSHLIHFNHSKSFWDMVNKYCPDYRKCKKLLKEGVL